MDLYEILGLTSSATKTEIKKAYRDLAIVYHPDKNRGEDTTDKFIEIQFAYNTLIDDTKKENYKKLSFGEKKNQVYDFMKEYIYERFPNIKFQKIISNFYPDENEFRDDINNFNFSNIFSKLKKKFVDDEINNDEIISATKMPSISCISCGKCNCVCNKYQYIDQEKLNIHHIQRITIDEKYNSFEKQILIRRKTKEEIKININCNKTEIIIVNEGETLNGIHGNIYINLICDIDKKYMCMDKYDILTFYNISLYEYIYGGTINMTHFGDNIKYDFPCCIDNSTYIHLDNYGFTEDNNMKIKRGVLHIKLCINGFDNNSDRDLYNKNKQLIKELFS